MKIPFVFSGLFALLFFSCDQLDEVSLNDVSAPVDLEFVVASNDSIGELEKEVDATTNSDFMNNKSKIQSLEIEKITYTTMALGSTAADSVILGKLDWLNPKTNAYEEVSAINNKKLTVGLPNDLALQPGPLTQMANQFTGAPYKAKLRMRAAMNKKPVDFIMKVKVYLKLKVKL